MEGSPGWCWESIQKGSSRCVLPSLYKHATKEKLRWVLLFCVPDSQKGGKYVMDIFQDLKRLSAKHLVHLCSFKWWKEFIFWLLLCFMGSSADRWGRDKHSRCIIAPPFCPEHWGGSAAHPGVGIRKTPWKDTGRDCQVTVHQPCFWAVGPNV